MKKDVAIKVENLSKKYQIGKKQLYVTLRDQLATLPKRIFNKQKTKSFWALKNIGFEVKKGEVIGIIGKNGAGKSTLLKVLSRITEPTEGKITMKGKVASLLEVGTGFNQELTGRDNIYLNGAILGMKRSEINKKFNKIIKFSGIEKFLDTPVKHYSSGMYTRLAFSVAAHLDSEILIVDEVLAVGDSEFQKKCLGKMEDISKNEGRTVLFVSHNMNSIRRLCQKGIFLKDGKIAAKGNIESVISKYTKAFSVNKSFAPIKIPEIGITIDKISINKKGNGKVYPGKPMKILIDLSAQKKVEGLGIQVMISNNDTIGCIFLTNTKTTEGMNVVINKGKNYFVCEIKNFNLSSGKYSLGFGINIPFLKSYYFNTDLLHFDAIENVFKNSLLPTLPKHSHVYLDHKWTINK